MKTASTRYFAGQTVWPRALTAVIGCGYISYLGALAPLAVSACATTDHGSLHDAQGDANSTPAPDAVTSVPAHCGSVTNSVDTCFLGVPFAECPGKFEPRAYCSAESPHGEAPCVWVSNGCPFEKKTVPLTSDCSCGAQCGNTELRPSIVNYMLGYGGLPWDRNRAANLTVDTDLLVAVQTNVDCIPCIGECQPYPCFADWLRVLRRAPGTISILIVGGGQLAGPALDIEIIADEDPLRARACWREFTDAPGNCEAPEPLCATSGHLSLDRKPAIADVAALQGKLTAKFEDGRTVEASFGK